MIHPWFMDAAEVVYKNANVWADLSGIFAGDAAAFAALAARGRLQRTVERLREALEYAERPDRFVRQRLAARPDDGVPGVSRPAAGRPGMAADSGRQRSRVVWRVSGRRNPANHPSKWPMAVRKPLGLP
ncbi:MAG: hypothetical protein P9F75_17675 [Candidatus Contendobacter sp.]|nr:hypothetical protein [Candidatus Contendobacter sp.]